MREHSQRATWPFLCMLSCLFVLSITAPRSWERIARERPYELDPDPNAPLKLFENRPSDPPAKTAALEPASPPIAASQSASDSRTADVTGMPDALRFPLEESTPNIAIGAERYEPNPTHLANRPDREPLEPVHSELKSVKVTETAQGVSEIDPTLDTAAWIEPAALVELFNVIARHEGCEYWAEEATGVVDRWSLESGLESAQANALLDRVEGLIQSADLLSAEVQSSDAATWLRRGRYALVRRLALWRRVATTVRERAIANTEVKPDPEQLAICLADVDQLTRGAAEGPAWRRYLLIEMLGDASGAPASDQQRRVAQQVLKRLEDPRLTSVQKRFIAEGPVAELSDELRHWATEPIAWAPLVARLESYEHDPRQRDAEALASDIWRLRWSSSQEDQQLARELETHYRNCNLRIAVHHRLLDRLLPSDEHGQEEPVRQQLMGMQVRGRRTTTTELNVQLVPNVGRLRWNLEAYGNIDSDTSLRSGPATLFNDGSATFRVEQPMELGLEGIRADSAQAQADSSNRLRSFRTDFDGIPLLGPLVRSEVVRQHDERRGEARRAIERIVATTALDLFEQDVNAQLNEANQVLDQRVFVPLERLSLVPTATDFRTTEERLVLRARLATGDQLGAHTPRPRAPSDSLISAQVHESALNNVIDQLELEGKTFSARDLVEWIGHKLNVRDVLAEESPRDDVWLALAKDDPVTIRFDQGRVRLRLAFEWLQKGRRRWRNFEVHVAYMPDPKSRHGALVRDGIIQLSGERLGARAQIALRTVFSKTFSAERRWYVIPQRITDDPRLSDLAVTQFDLEDGWMGLALAPTRSRRDEASTARTKGTLRR